MPIYEYHCDACGRNFEKLQSVNDAPLTVCEHCGKEGLRKMLSAPSVQFKGEGWYVTDYKKPSKDKSANKDNPTQTTASSDSKESKKGTETKEGGV